MQSHLHNFLFDPNFNLGTDSLYSSQSLTAGLSPLRLGATAWLDASDPSNNRTLPANNTALTPWVDKAGNGHNATQGTPSATPSFILNDVGTPAIKAVAASSQNYALNTTINTNGTTTLVVVAGISSVAGYIFSGNGTSSRPAMLFNFVANTFEWFNSTDRHSFGTATSGYHMLAITQTDAVNCTGYFDGVQAFSFTPTMTLNNNLITRLFSSTGGTADFYNGGMKTFIFFNKVLSKTQLTSLFSFLSQRYNVVG